MSKVKFDILYSDGSVELFDSDRSGNHLSFIQQDIGTWLYRPTSVLVHGTRQKKQGRHASKNDSVEYSPIFV